MSNGAKPGQVSAEAGQARRVPCSGQRARHDPGYEAPMAAKSGVSSPAGDARAAGTTR